MDVGRFLSDEKYFESQMDLIQMQAELREISGLIPIVDVGADEASGFRGTHTAKHGTKSQRKDKRKRAKAARKRNR